jgi:hypothetical protein
VTRKVVTGIMLASVSIGLSVALVVALLQVFDSNHQTPWPVQLQRLGAVTLWISVLAAALLIFARVRGAR